MDLRARRTSGIGSGNGSGRGSKFGLTGADRGNGFGIDPVAEQFKIDMGDPVEERSFRVAFNSFLHAERSDQQRQINRVERIRNIVGGLHIFSPIPLIIAAFSVGRLHDGAGKYILVVFLVILQLLIAAFTLHTFNDNAVRYNTLQTLYDACYTHYSPALIKTREDSRDITSRYCFRGLLAISICVAVIILLSGFP